MQGDTEAGELISASQARGRVYQAKQRVGPERQAQAHKLAAPQQPIDQLPGHRDKPAPAIFLSREGSH
jgi:hypothetical protein